VSLRDNFNREIGGQNCWRAPFRLAARLTCSRLIQCPLSAAKTSTASAAKCRQSWQRVGEGIAARVVPSALGEHHGSMAMDKVEAHEEDLRLVI